jgi:hypothetical protein
MNCIACRRPIGGDYDAPDGALVFTSHGNYGSHLFDSMNEWLRIVICDDCVRETAVRGEVYLGRRSPPRIPNYYTPFTPDIELVDPCVSS